ncbi:hypothetical protein L2E82_18977 [Cichorium intybus]|uniref:Uncharacterized protein n=1 Tax=Cichorium intybus TaxID=13427 RepID=A0ACB9FC57_CICIN|nr:hypothetical protein L2E82_18977 [Cichorium intybus]
MDLTKSILTIFILTLITIHLQIHCVEARHLKTIHVKETIVKGGTNDTPYGSEAVVTKPTLPTPPSESLVGSQSLVPPPPHAVEDFRPTAPGHSPGAGHSIHD